MKHTVLSIAALIAAILPSWNQVRAGDAVNLRELPAEEFLAYARQPFPQNGWGRFSGHAICVGPAGRKRASIALAALFRPDFVRAQVVVDETAVYEINQIRYVHGTPHTTVHEPDVEVAFGLRDFGLKPEDVTFSFLHWDFVRELDMQQFRGQQCRVFELHHPGSAGKAVSWFATDTPFPLYVEFHDDNTGEPTRTIQFTDFKRQGDAYFIQNFRVEGRDWKTRVRLPVGEIRLSDDVPPPVDLFVADACVD